MLPLPQELMTDVSTLQWLDAKQIKAQFGELIPDCMECNRAELLRSVVIYRLQERHYRMSVPDNIAAILAKTVEGTNLYHAPADDITSNGKKLVRRYRGKDYEVRILADNRIEYNGRVYKSLTAVAEEITGLHWSGFNFFGIKKNAN